MTPHRLRAALLFLQIASAVLMWLAAGNNNATAFAILSTLTAAVVLSVGWITYRRFSSRDAVRDDPCLQADSLIAHGWLAAMTYAWGALVLTLVYGLTDISWRHGLQYASGMALFAAMIFAYLYACREGSSLREQRALDGAAWLSALQGVAAAAALLFLLTSGKLFLGKPDWPANIVFLAGGIPIVILNALAVLAHRRLARAAQA